MSILLKDNFSYFDIDRNKATLFMITVRCRRSFRQLQQLHHHRLTVTQLTFSGSGDALLAVSRDRGWSLYARQLQAGGDIYVTHYNITRSPSFENSITHIQLSRLSCSGFIHFWSVSSNVIALSSLFPYLWPAFPCYQWSQSALLLVSLSSSTYGTSSKYSAYICLTTLLFSFL